MASGRIEQQIDLRVTGLKDVQQAEKAVNQLDGTKAKVTVDVDAKAAQRTVSDVLDDVKKLSKSDAQIVLGIRAAAVEKELSDILADVARVDGDRATIDVQLERAAELRGDLDQLSTAVKDLDGTTAHVNIDSTGARQGMGDIVDGADQANSAVANMVGNSAQDLGELGGVAGSAGVAVGQLAEYFTDAAIKARGLGQGIGQIFKSFAGAAAPIALLSGAFALFSSEMNKHKAAAEANKQQIDELFDSLQEGKTVVDAFNKSIEDTGQFKFPGLGDILPDMNKLGITVDEFVRLSKLPEPELRKWADAQKAVAGGEGDLDSLRNVVFSLAQATQNSATAEQRHALTAKATGADVRALNDAYAAAADANADWRKGLADNSAQLERIDELTQQATEGTRAYDQALAGMDWGGAALDGAAAGMAKFHEQFFGLKDIASANEAAFDALGQSLTENGKSFDLNTEKGRNNQEALEALASTIDTQLAAAYADSGGDLDTFKGKAQAISDTLKQRLQKELHLSATKADELITQLGLTPTDIETRYQLSGTEEARMKIGLLQGSIDALPKDVQARVTQQIIAGDYQGALATVQHYYNTHHADVPVDAEAGDTATALNMMQRRLNGTPLFVDVRARGLQVSDAGGVVGPNGGIAGETGPEFITTPDGRRMLLTGATVVPARTRVTRRTLSERMLRAGTSPTGAGTPWWQLSQAQRTVTVNLKLQTAVVGSRFEVERAVRRATRDGIRLAGAR